MINFSKRICDKITSKRLPDYVFSDQIRYLLVDGMIVLEVGCNLRPILSRSKRYLLHGVDPDPDIQVCDSEGVFDKFFHNRFEDIDDSYRCDLIIMDMVLEHMENADLNLIKAYNMLNPGGIIISNQPSNLHPFSLLNQILPQKLKCSILATLRPWSKPGKITGWPAYYKLCNPLAIERFFETRGWEIEVLRCEYNAADYFSWCIPLFLGVFWYEKLISLMRFRFLCSHFFFVTKKPLISELRR